MALAFPLSIDAFFGGLRVRTCSFHLPPAVKGSGLTGDGDILTANRGQRLFRGTIALRKGDFNEGSAAEALIDTLGEAGRTFFVYPITKPRPAKVVKGSAMDTALQAASVTIKAIASNNRDLELEGLPPGLVLSVGDYLSFQYGESPVRYALHRLARGGTANGGGVAAVEASNFIRDGAEAGLAVQLIRPFCKAVVKPASVQPGMAATVFIDGIAFDWQQTLR